jgi:hypothetical protein
VLRHHVDSQHDLAGNNNGGLEACYHYLQHAEEALPSTCLVVCPALPTMVQLYLLQSLSVCTQAAGAPAVLQACDGAVTVLLCRHAQQCLMFQLATLEDMRNQG